MSGSRKKSKRVKKFIKKLKHEHSLDKKHYEERINNLEMEQTCGTNGITSQPC